MLQRAEEERKIKEEEEKKEKLRLIKERKELERKASDHNFVNYVFIWWVKITDVEFTNDFNFDKRNSAIIPTKLAAFASWLRFNFLFGSQVINSAAGES